MAERLVGEAVGTQVTRPSGIVTVLTDFGTTDGYVAAMKGALLSVNPSATLVDITHHIPSQEVTEAAFQLATVWTAFPAGTIHLSVIDPGVGTDRRALAVEVQDHVFVTPDNGLLTMILATSAAVRAVVLENRRFFRQEISSTFHGRDVFAPVAGALSTGKIALTELGPEINVDSIVRLPWIPVSDEPGQTRAPVVSVDRFGNCRTLITESTLPADRTSVYVRCRDVTVHGIQNTYNDVPLGKTLALFGSHGGLEIAVRGGSAAQSWDIERGDMVTVFSR